MDEVKKPRKRKDQKLVFLKWNYDLQPLYENGEVKAEQPVKKTSNKQTREGLRDVNRCNIKQTHATLSANGTHYGKPIDLMNTLPN